MVSIPSSHSKKNSSIIRMDSLPDIRPLGSIHEARGYQPTYTWFLESVESDALQKRHVLKLQGVAPVSHKSAIIEFEAPEGCLEDSNELFLHFLGLEKSFTIAIPRELICGRITLLDLNIIPPNPIPDSYSITYKLASTNLSH